MSLSISLDTGVSGLRAAQNAMDTAAHNIANANTEGFSRQEVVFVAVPPVQGKFDGKGIASTQIGLGVDFSQVRRIRDLLLDTQYRSIRGLNDQYQAQASALSEAENTLNEPSDQGLHEQLTRFFNAFRDLTSQPESAAARAAAVQQGVTLAATFNREATLLTEQRDALDNSLDVNVSDVNAMANQIADLNKQIRISSVAGAPSNDLHDQRDLLLDKLAGLVGATSQAGSNDTVNVFLGAHALVNNVTVDPLATAPDAANNGLGKIYWTSDLTQTAIPTATFTGTIRGTLDARDINVTGLLNSINSFTGTLISAVNTAHQAGFGLNNATGLPYFTGTDAATIGVNSTLVANPQNLATSDAANEPGNPNTATAIATIQSQLLFNGNSSTANDAYDAIVTGLGVSTQQAKGLAQNQQTLLQQIDRSRQAVSGVSLDEEMANMMKSQHAYQAAARVITTADNMLDTLINHMLV